MLSTKKIDDAPGTYLVKHLSTRQTARNSPKATCVSRAATEVKKKDGTSHNYHAPSTAVAGDNGTKAYGWRCAWRKTRIRRRAHLTPAHLVQIVYARMRPTELNLDETQFDSQLVGPEWPSAKSEIARKLPLPVRPGCVDARFISLPLREASSPIEQARAERRPLNECLRGAALSRAPRIGSERHAPSPQSCQEWQWLAQVADLSGVEFPTEKVSHAPKPPEGGVASARNFDNLKIVIEFLEGQRPPRPTQDNDECRDPIQMQYSPRHTEGKRVGDGKTPLLRTRVKDCDDGVA